MAASTSYPELKNFHVREALVPDSKWIRYLLAFGADQAILEIKKPSTIKRDQVEEALPFINFNSANDVHFTGFVMHEGYRNDCKVVYPAEPSLIEMHRVRSVVRKETFMDYANFTSKFVWPSCKWIYNILEGKAETDRVLLRDSDPRNGFALARTVNWDGSNLKELSYIAFVMRRNLKSLRDLTNMEIPLLRNIHRQCVKAIAQKHELHEADIQARILYHPVYWHLQVNFYLKMSVGNDPLDLVNVCKNLEQNTWYYKTTMLKVDCRLPRLAAKLPEFREQDELTLQKKRFGGWRQQNGGQRNGRPWNGSQGTWSQQSGSQSGSQAGSQGSWRPQNGGQRTWSQSGSQAGSQSSWRPQNGYQKYDGPSTSLSR